MASVNDPVTIEFIRIGLNLSLSGTTIKVIDEVGGLTNTEVLINDGSI